MTSRISRGLLAASAVVAISMIGAGAAQASQLFPIGSQMTVTDVDMTSPDEAALISDPTHSPVSTWATGIIFTLGDGEKIVVNCDDLWDEIGLGSSDTFQVAAFSGQSSAPNYGYPGTSFTGTQITEMSWLEAQSELLYLNVDSVSGLESLISTPTNIVTGYDAEQVYGAMQLASWELSNPSSVSFMLADPDLRRQMGEDAREHVAAHFSEQSVSSHLTEEYWRLLGECGYPVNRPSDPIPVRAR